MRWTKAAKKRAIIKWINTGKEFHLGTQLYLKFGSNVAFKNKLRRLLRPFEQTKAQERIEKSLRRIAGLPPVNVRSPQIIKLVTEPPASPKESPSPVSPPSQPDRRAQVDVTHEKLVVNMAKLVNTRMRLSNQLSDEVFGLLNKGASIDKLQLNYRADRNIIKEIDSLNKEITALHRRTKYYEKHGKLPDQHSAKEVFVAAECFDLKILQKKMNNLYSNLSKAKKRLPLLVGRPAAELKMKIDAWNIDLELIKKRKSELNG